VVVTEDVRRSFRIVWVTLSLVILAVLASPFALGRERLTRLTPVCEWKAKYGKECSFCGMTTSFLDISEGRLGEATHANRAGIPLYLLFVANEICALAFIRRRGAI
jgi:hypothetical protein